MFEAGTRIGFLARARDPASWAMILALVGGGCSSAGEPAFQPVVMASEQPEPSFIALDATHVYWVNQGTPSVYEDGSIVKAPLSGGPPTVLAAGQHLPVRIAVDATSVYWTNQTEGVMRVPLAGGDRIKVADPGGNVVVGLAIDTTSAYWITADFQSGSTCVMRAPLEGGTPAVLTCGAYDPGDLTVGADYIYWTSGATGSVGRVMRAPVAGGQAVELATGLPLPGAIAVDAANVYWIDNDGIKKLSLSGGAPVTLTEGGGAQLAVDATHLYWTARDGAMRMSLSGGAPVTLASGGSFAIAVDTHTIVWTDPDAGTVMGLAKTVD